MKTVDREKLWEEYQKKKTPELREKLIFAACQACCRKIEHVSRI